MVVRQNFGFIPPAETRQTRRFIFFNGVVHCTCVIAEGNGLTGQASVRVQLPTLVEGNCSLGPAN